MTEIISIRPSDLSVQEREGKYFICHEDKPLKTPTGIDLAHGDPALLQHMIHEFEEYPEISLKDDRITGKFPLCSFMLFATQKDFIERGNKFSREEYRKLLQSDPILHPEETHSEEQLKSWKGAHRFLEEIEGGDGVTLLESKPPEDKSPPLSDQDENQNYANGSFSPLINELMKLSAPQKAVLIYLYRLHYKNLLYPLMLVLKRCDPAEYANAILATTGAPGRIAGKTDQAKSREETHREIFRRIRGNARTCLEYLHFFQKKNTLETLIEKGEDEKLEFKSTLRWNLKAGKKDDAMTHACLKTLAAFLNTEGGALLIGVADDGTIIGIEQDQFPNTDKFLLHLFNIIKSSLGEDTAALVSSDLFQAGDKTVCRIDCAKSPKPVFLQFKKNQDEEFYIRTGPGSTKLSPSKLLKYIGEHFR